MTKIIISYSYRQLLDRWEFFHIRAYFDIARGEIMGSAQSAIMARPQIYIRCNFCNQSISHNLLIPGMIGKDGRRVAVAASTVTSSLPKFKVNNVW